MLGASSKGGGESSGSGLGGGTGTDRTTGEGSYEESEELRGPLGCKGGATCANYGGR